MIVIGSFQPNYSIHSKFGKTKEGNQNVKPTAVKWKHVIPRQKDLSITWQVSTLNLAFANNSFLTVERLCRYKVFHGQRCKGQTKEAGSLYRLISEILMDATL